MRTRESKLADNEIMFRQVNERIVELTDMWSEDLNGVCECADTACAAVLHISHDEYKQLRQNPRRFAVLPGHAVPDIEEIVERHDTYDVVEKHVEAHEQVEAVEPRRE